VHELSRFLTRALILCRYFGAREIRFVDMSIYNAHIPQGNQSSQIAPVLHTFSGGYRPDMHYSKLIPLAAEFDNVTFPDGNLLNRIEFAGQARQPAGY
jgi:hypothetical protein